jgi:hypothetical protein
MLGYRLQTLCRVRDFVRLDAGGKQAGVHGKHMIAGGFRPPQLLKLTQLFWFFVGEVSACEKSLSM